MIAGVILVGFFTAVIMGVLLWRYIEVYERVGIERAKAGGDQRALAVEDLSTRVDEIEKYMTGEDYRRKNGGN